VLIELLLFSAPFVVFYLYRMASRDMSVKDRWPLTSLVIAGGVLAVGALVLGPLLEPSDGGKCYQAPRYVNGERIPGKQVECSEIAVPGRDTPVPAPAPPVAPRDEEIGRPQ